MCPYHQCRTNGINSDTIDATTSGITSATSGGTINVSYSTT